MHDGAETKKIVEALAEHDFQEMRLSRMIHASGCEYIVFCAYCQHIKKQGAFDPGIIKFHYNKLISLRKGIFLLFSPYI